MLNYKHLHYFQAVATLGTVVQAGQQLGVSAQAISMQLQLLEEQVGEQLFQKHGRNLRLTTAGRTVLQYANRIFELGKELEQAALRGAVTEQERLRVGICSVIPTSMGFQLLQPASTAGLAMRLVCHKGRFDELLHDLVACKLDLVLADRPLPRGGTVRGYSRLLGSSSVAVLGHPDLCRAWAGHFPVRLKNAPFLLPGPDAMVQSQLQSWLDANNLRPIVVGQFDDSALLESFAQAGTGFVAVPAVLVDTICMEYGLEQIGTIASIAEKFYTVSLGRRDDYTPLRWIITGATAVFGTVEHCKLLNG